MNPEWTEMQPGYEKHGKNQIYCIFCHVGNYEVMSHKQMVFNVLFLIGNRTVSSVVTYHPRQNPSFK